MTSKENDFGSWGSYRDIVGTFQWNALVWNISSYSNEQASQLIFNFFVAKWMTIFLKKMKDGNDETKWTIKWMSFYLNWTHRQWHSCN